MKSEQALVFQIRKLEPGPNRFYIEPSIESLELGKYHFLKPLGCEIILTLTGHRVDMELKLETTVEIECSLCGEPASFNIKNTSKAAFLPESERKLENTEVDTTDLEFYSEEINLKEFARDAFILAFPIAATCREECKGLCPSCGTNLNYNTCNCKQLAGNSQFKNLKRLVDE